jgi:hypothetical protein
MVLAVRGHEGVPTGGRRSRSGYGPRPDLEYVQYDGPWKNPDWWDH